MAKFGLKSCPLEIKLTMNPLNSIKKIIVSESRIKLLQELYYQPNDMFYIRQLTRMTGEKLNSVRRELKNLDQAGILESEWRANKRFYWVNPNHVFYQELLGMVMKTKGLGKDLINNEKKLGQIKYAIFSGKFGRDIDPEGEEIEVLIVGQVVLPELGVLVRKEEEHRGREINYTVMEVDEFNYRKKNRDPFLTEILLQSRIMIIGDEQKMAAS